MRGRTDKFGVSLDMEEGGEEAEVCYRHPHQKNGAPTQRSIAQRGGEWRGDGTADIGKAVDHTGDGGNAVVFDEIR